MKILALLILLSSNVFASTYKLESSKGSFSGLAIGKPSLMKIKIEGQGPEGVLTEKDGNLSGILKLDLKNLKTGIDLRDRHMKDKYLEVSKFPESQLEITNLKTPGSDSEEAFSGTLTLKGQVKPVSGTYQFKENNLVAKFKFSIKDYPIDTPKYLGVEVTDVVEVEIQSQVLKE